MAAAVLSVVYDYETDWNAVVSFEGSIFARMLDQHVPDSALRSLAQALFERDLSGCMSECGFERGEDALAFYSTFIGSTWMSGINAAQLASNGRALQVLDDLLDFEKDCAAEHTNCFRTEQRSRYLADGESFLESDFFRALQSRSLVYTWVAARCREVINKLRGLAPSYADLGRSCRPVTAIFAAVLVVLGFRLLHVPLTSAILFAACFAAVTGSIMVFNDLSDRDPDASKGKILAITHTLPLVRFWLQVSAVTSVLVLAIAAIDVRVAVLAGIVWLMGLVYSLLRPPFPLKTLVVSLCAAAPLLCGSVFTRMLDFRSMLVFYIFASTIFVREIAKDIEDSESDVGHKSTLATQQGQLPALLACLAFGYFPALGIALYPGWFVKAAALPLAGAYFVGGLAFTRPQYIRRVRGCIDVLLAVTIAVLIVAS